MQVHKAKEYWRIAKAATVSVVEARSLYNVGLSPTRISEMRDSWSLLRRAWSVPNYINGAHLGAG
jgi:hypothetical protein